MSFADFLENELLDHVWGNAAFAPASPLFIGLSTTAPADDGTNITEPTNGYARVSVTNNLTNWPAAVGGAKANGTDFTFPTATGPWGTVTHAFISDAASGGNIYGSGALTTAKTIDNGDTASFATGDFDITLD